MARLFRKLNRIDSPNSVHYVFVFHTFNLRSLGSLSPPNLPLDILLKTQPLSPAIPSSKYFHLLRLHVTRPLENLFVESAALGEVQFLIRNHVDVVLQHIVKAASGARNAWRSDSDSSQGESIIWATELLGWCGVVVSAVVKHGPRASWKERRMTMMFETPCVTAAQSPQIEDDIMHRVDLDDLPNKGADTEFLYEVLVSSLVASKQLGHYK
jgi:hypothetical protein